jgi:hypothetical protein
MPPEEGFTRLCPNDAAMQAASLAGIAFIVALVLYCTDIMIKDIKEWRAEEERRARLPKRDDDDDQFPPMFPGAF